MAEQAEEPVRRAEWRRLELASALSFIAGATDTAGFLGLSGLFTAHVTGNFVLIGAALAHGSAAGILGKLLALPVFVAVVALARFGAEALERRGLPVLRNLLLAKTCFLAMFLLLGAGFGPFPDADAPVALLAGMAGVTAMAIQNAIGRLRMASAPPTTVMTGNVTQLVMDAIELRRGTAPPEARWRAGRMLRSILAFTLGCAASAGLYAMAGLLCLALPLAVAAWAALLRVEIEGGATA